MNVIDRFRLDGRVALITGASSGIGATLAQGFAAAGARVVLAARRTDRLAVVAQRIGDAGGSALVVECDVTKPASIIAAFDSAAASGAAPDILVNNAGVADARRFLQVTPEARDRILSTNFIGPWDLCQEFARRLQQAERGGSIVNIASILGLGAGVGYSAYSASKSAIVQLTRTLALEFTPLGIRVNAIAPGWFVSEMNAAYFESPAGQAHIARMPARRTGKLEELVGPALLLASDAGSYINGVVLPVDGAHHVALV